MAMAMEVEPLEVEAKLREIDVANENQNEQPSVQHADFVARFLASRACTRYQRFYVLLNSVCVGHTTRNVESEFKQRLAAAAAPTTTTTRPDTAAHTIDRVLRMLDAFDVLIDDALPQLKSTVRTGAIVASRFGNPLFRTVLARVIDQSLVHMRDLIASRYPDPNTMPDIPPLDVIATDRGETTSSSTSNSSSSTTASAPSPTGVAVQVPTTSSGASSRVITPAQLARLPLKVIESMRARGELPADFVLPTTSPSSSCGHDHSHDHANSHTHVQSTSPSAHAAQPQPPLPTSVQAPTQTPSTPPSQRADTLLQTLCMYLHRSFGDMKRIDYGTGHEMNFVCFLFCLHQLGMFGRSTDGGDDESDPPLSFSAVVSQLPADATLQALLEADKLDVMPAPTAFVARALALVVFPRYMRLMRRFQTLFLLEPAGSRGVWGLDDFSFLPFLWGSAQLVNHLHLKPKSVCNSEILDGFAGDFMYLDAIKFIMQVKSCSFAEHSPMLHDITIVKTWEQVNRGLLRMYVGEVLSKFTVVQHFLFTPTLLPRDTILPIRTDLVPAEPPSCCSDIIHFPSAYQDVVG